jgi:hypothetical protein
MSNIVQSKTDSYALLALESGSVTLSFDNPTQAGNSVVFAIVYEQFGSSPASSGLNVSDSQGLAYSRATADIIQQVGVYFAGNFELLYSGMACLFATGSQAASDGVTFTFNPSVLGVCTVGIFEVAGTIQFDTGTSNYATGNPLTSIATGNISPATGYFEVAACLECLSSSITGVSSGWSLFGANIYVGVLAYASQEENSATFTLDYPMEAVPLPAGAAIWAFKQPAPTYSISGNAGIANATVSYSGTASGSVVADGSGNYSIPGLLNGSYTITPSRPGYTFTPTSQNETINGANITGVNFTLAVIPPKGVGFSPSFVAQNEGGLRIYVSPGGINGFGANGQFVSVPANAQTYVWVYSNGIVAAGPQAPSGAFAIALVTSGKIQVSGTGNPNSGAYVLADGIISIADIRST